MQKIKSKDNEYLKSVKFIDEDIIASYLFNFKEKKQIFRITSNTSYYEKIVSQEFHNEAGFLVNNIFVIIREKNISFFDLINNTSKKSDYKSQLKNLRIKA